MARPRPSRADCVQLDFLLFVATGMLPSFNSALVKRCLANEKMANHKQIMDCIFFLANGLGETWRSASKEVAAGMVLIALAKNAELKNFLNSNGWKLVVSFVRCNPYIAKNLSPRTMDEIFTYQQAIPAPMLATC